MWNHLWRRSHQKRKRRREVRVKRELIMRKSKSLKGVEKSRQLLKRKRRPHLQKSHQLKKRLQ